jgi:hypothetical protein
MKKFLFLICFLGASVIWNSCKKSIKWNLDKTAPALSTLNVDNVLGKSATVNFIIKHNAGSEIYRCGVCFSDSEEPNLVNSQIMEIPLAGKKSHSPGNYKLILSDLGENKIYYVRAFAFNQVGIGFGEVLKFQTKKLPSVTTDTFFDIGTSTAMCSGTVTSDWGFPMKERGIMWSTDSLFASSKTVSTSMGSGVGFFQGQITKLPIGTKVFFRAYAISEGGTAFGLIKSLKTLNAGMAGVRTMEISKIKSFSLLLSGDIFDDGASLVKNRGFVLGLSPNVSHSDIVINCGSGTGQFEKIVVDLIAGETYYARAFAENSSGIKYGNEVSGRLPDTIPVLNTVSASNITDISMKTGGYQIRNIGIGILQKGVCWTSKGTPTISDSLTQDGTGSEDFISQLNFLKGNTVYYYRAYATNSIGTGYGDVKFTKTLITVSKPTVETLPTSTFLNYNSYSANIGGNVIDDGNDSYVKRGMCWSKSSNPSLSDSFTIDGNGKGTYYSSIRNLYANTTYYYRAYATNSKGTSYGNVYSFRTLDAIIPTPNTVQVNSIFSNRISCAGKILNNGGADILQKGFCWSKSNANPQISIDFKTSNGTGNTDFSGVLTLLEPGVSYFVRTYATNSKGTGYGGVVKFTTMAGKPSVVTGNFTNLTQVSFTVSGQTISDSGSLITDRGICYSKTATPTINDIKINNGTGLGNYVINVSGLEPTTNYYVRAYATNNEGTAYGLEKIITTLSPTIPTITTVSPNSITLTTAKSGGTNLSDGGTSITEKGVCWNTTGTPTYSSSKTNNGSGSSNFTSVISGLTTGKTYYIRAYAKNNVGTSYGSQFAFIPNLGTPTLKSYINGAVVPSPYFYLEWSCVDSATSYDLQFSRSSSFAGTVYNLPKAPGGWLSMTGVHSGSQTGNCSSGSVLSDMLQTTTTANPGTYTFYWRVRARTATVTGNWSTVSTFKVVK